VDGELGRKVGQSSFVLVSNSQSLNHPTHSNMQLLTRTLVALSIAASTFGAVLKRDVPTISADIDDISTQVTALDNAINAFPDSGGSLTSALVGTLQTRL